MINQIPEWLQIFLYSMIPGFESRFVIPLIAINQFNWLWWEAFPFAIAGNMFLVPFGLLFLHKIEKILSRIDFFKKAMDFVFPKIRKKADKKIQRYESLALIFFVSSSTIENMLSSPFPSTPSEPIISIVDASWRVTLTL